MIWIYNPTFAIQASTHSLRCRRTTPTSRSSGLNRHSGGSWTPFAHRSRQFARLAKSYAGKFR